MKPLRPLVLCGCVFVLWLAAPAKGAQARDEYRLGPRDVLEIAVWDQADLSGKYTVRADGTFVFPFIGQVTTTGKTVGEVEVDIRDRLGKGYLRSPQVSVKVVEYQSQWLFVIGEVVTPTNVPLSGSLTLVEALTRAGGLAKTAGTEVIILRLSGDTKATGPLVPGQPGVEQVASVSLQAMHSGQLKDNVVLRDGDTIFVPRAEEVFVIGQVKTPGPVAFARDLTVFKAISMAGGLTELGSQGRIRIVRIVDGEKKEIKAKYTDLLEPGDTVMVPTRWF